MMANYFGVLRDLLINQMIVSCINNCLLYDDDAIHDSFSPLNYSCDCLSTTQLTRIK
jgi:hypothetical protein